MLFPIQWDEPFGLVLIEAMACGTPVLAMPGGSVEEIVADGVAGYVCESAEKMAVRARSLNLAPAKVREYAEQNFSARRMAEDYLRLYREILQAPAPEQDAQDEDVPPRLVA
jgi:glycosyltransferase involved in cell wall biosynthesis